jgi:putative ubiquitin-RnfH superfamily antitoxin RatB of RatAB toxin-antitoxin module
MGIFGKSVKPHDYVMRPGDRVEIYRPLVADPKASRKARADKAKDA